VTAEARLLLAASQHRVLGRAVRLVAVDARHDALGYLVALGQREERANGGMAAVAERHRRLLVAPRRAAHRLGERIGGPDHGSSDAPMRVWAKRAADAGAGRLP